MTQTQSRGLLSILRLLHEDVCRVLLNSQERCLSQVSVKFQDQVFTRIFIFCPTPRARAQRYKTNLKKKKKSQGVDFQDPVGKAVPIFSVDHI